MANAVDSLVKALATRLATISGLTVLKEWPAANQKLVLPSVTITQGEPKFRALDPYLLSITNPNVAHEVTSVKIVGEYDLVIQLDLWARNKVERAQYFELLFAKLNPDITPMGLSLQMSDYSNLWARYDLDSHQFVDDEATAQRQEWRCKLSLLANTRAVLSKTEFAIITIENNVTTPDTI